MPRVYVSIGSNVDRRKSVSGAIADIETLYDDVAVSKIYECPAVGFSGEPFLNLVAAFTTEKPIEELVAELKDVEHKYGRVREAEKFSNRTLDIDVLLYGDLVAHEERIDVPRYEIRKYAFVLRPLSEMNPGGVHPELNKTYAELWGEFDDSEQPMWEYDLQADAKVV